MTTLHPSFAQRHSKWIRKLGFESPTLVQQLVLPEMQSGEDLIVCMETGSGKTAAFWNSYGPKLVTRS